MSAKHWNRYLLELIGQVCDITLKDKLIKSVLILDIGIDDMIIFYQRDKGLGRRGFIQISDIQVEETGEEPAFKVPRPRSVDSQKVEGYY